MPNLDYLESRPSATELALFPERPLVAEKPLPQSRVAADAIYSALAEDIAAENEPSPEAQR